MRKTIKIARVGILPHPLALQVIAIGGGAREALVAELRELFTIKTLSVMNKELINFDTDELDALSVDVQKQAKGGVWALILGGLAILVLTGCQCADEINNGCTNEECPKGKQ